MKLKKILWDNIFGIGITVYSLLIISYISNNIIRYKFDIYLIILLSITVVYYMLKKYVSRELVKTVFLGCSFVALFMFTSSDIKTLYNNIDYDEFFMGYRERLIWKIKTSYIQDKIFESKMLRLQIAGQAFYMPNEVELKRERANEVFDFVNYGLSDPEEEFIWTDGQLVKIPLYIDNTIKKGKIIFTAEGFGQQEVYIYVDDVLFNTIILEYDRQQIEIPFEKQNSDFVIVKFVIPTANKSPKDLDISDDIRKLGICLHKIEIKEEDNV